MKSRTISASLVSVFTVVFSSGAAAFAANIVNSVVAAPVTYDGTTSGSPTELVVNFDTSLDPDVPGRALLAGRSISITLPDAFVENATLPFAAPFAIPECRTFPVVEEGVLQCNTAFLLQGWPQQPIAPPPRLHEKYSISRDGTHTLVITAKEDILPDPPDNPGIKQIHVGLKGFVNPVDGEYTIDVSAETGPDGAVETGAGRVAISSSAPPGIALTSVFNQPPPFRNTLYQAAKLGGGTPLPYDLLLWDRDGKPFVGVEVMPVSGPNRQTAVLRQGDRTVGHVAVEGPEGATGQSVSAGAPSSEVRAPVTGIPTARLTVDFQSGSKPGIYLIHFGLDDGNGVTTHVEVE